MSPQLPLTSFGWWLRRTAFGRAESKASLIRLFSFKKKIIQIDEVPKMHGQVRACFRETKTFLATCLFLKKAV